MKNWLQTISGLCLLLVLNSALQAQLVLNVKSAPFNATGDGTTNDTAAVKRAIIALNTPGGADNPNSAAVLYFPPGTYVIDPTYGGAVDFQEITRNGAWICGDGEKSILKRITRPPMTAANGNGILTFIADHVKVSDLTFDLNVCPAQDLNGNGILNDDATKEDDNHATALNMQGCDNIRVVNCRFFSTQVINYAYITANGGPFPNYNDSPTFHAVLTNGSDGCWVQNCRAENSQIKTAGGANTTAQFVLDNSFYQPYNYAVSFVSNNNSAQMRGCRISGNFIDGIGGAGAIYFGRDGSQADTFVVSHVQACNNQIVGFWEQALNPNGRIAITANHTRLSEGWIIANNVLHPSSYVSATNHKGIWFSGGTTGYYGDCLIMNNSVLNINKDGITASGGGWTGSMPAGDTTRTTSPATRIIGNHVENAAWGVWATGKRQLILGNTIVGNTGWGLALQGAFQDMTMARVIGNEIRNQKGTASDVAGLSLKTTGSFSITADVFANEFSDDQGTHTQKYGVYHTGSNITARYYDNRFNGNLTAPVFPTSPNPPTGSVKRDNAGW